MTSHDKKATDVVRVRALRDLDGYSRLISHRPVLPDSLGHLALRTSVLLLVMAMSSLVSAQAYISHSGYFGGNNETEAISMKVVNGETYFLGATEATDYPVTDGSVLKMDANGPTDDYVVTKLDVNGNIVYATYLGSSWDEEAENATLAVENGEVYILGQTDGDDYPVLNGLPYNGGDDAVLTKLDVDGNIVYSTYLGRTDRPDSDEEPSVLRVENGMAYVTGITDPGGSGPGSSNDVFLFKINPDGSIAYLKLIGGDQDITSGGTIRDGRGDEDEVSMAISNGEVYLFGLTNAVDFPVTDGSSLASRDDDFFIMKLDNAGNTVYASYLGGSEDEDHLFINTTPPLQVVNGELYVFGLSRSIDFPTPNGNSIPSEDSYFVVAKFDAAGNQVFGTSFGTSRRGSNFPGSYIVQDGVIYIANRISGDATGYPVTDGIPAPTNGDNLVVTKLDANTGSLLFSSFIFGGQNNDNPGPADLQVEDGYMYVYGVVDENPLPTTNGSTPNGDNDVFIVKLDPSGKIVYSSYIGGSEEERYGIDDKYADVSQLQVENGNIYFITETVSNDYPVTNSSTITDENRTIAITKLSFCSGYTPPPLTVTPATQTVCQFGLAAEIEAPPIVVPGGDLPTVFRNGAISEQDGIQVKYQWQSADDPNGPWTDIPAGILPGYLASVGGTDQYYRRKAYVPCCDVEYISEVAAILVNDNIAPEVSGDPVRFTCPDEPVTIGGSPTATEGSSPIASYLWDMDGFLDNASSPNPIATVMDQTIFTVTVTDQNSCQQIGQTVVLPVVADAGPDVDACEGIGVRIGTLPPPGLTGVTYSWMPTAGLSCSNCAQPIASPSVATTYEVSMTIPLFGGGSCTTTDEVIVTPVASPRDNFAGDDKVVCLGETTELGTPQEDGFSYTWAPGNYLRRNDRAEVTFEAGNLSLPVPNPITYFVTAEKAGCTFVDQVQVSVIEADADIDGCGPRSIGTPDRTPNLNETYSWELVSGPGGFTGPTDVPVTSVSASVGGTSIYRLTVTLDGVECVDEVEVPDCGCQVDIEVSDPNNCPSFFTNGGDPITLTASAAPVFGDPDAFIYNWSPAAGLSTTIGRTVELTDNINRTYTVTMTSPFDPNFSCSEIIEVNNPIWSLPVFDAQDGDICELNPTPVAIGQPVVAEYAYAWTGPNGFTSDMSNPSVTEAGAYTVTVTDIGSGCTVEDVATVNEVVVVADAGPDWEVCDNAIIQLGTPDLGLGYTYMWDPENSPWQNGTDETFDQPEVLITTDLTFTVTVTDPVTGCFSTDEVMVTVNNTPSLDPQPDATLCVGSNPVQIGGYPELPGVTYSWMPTNDLSCTDCPNPMASPDATTVYTVTATYPGQCQAAITDQITVNVEDISFDLGMDITYCPSDGPVNIGANAPMSGFTYSWDPRTDLSNRFIANPTASPSVPTTYSLRIRQSAAPFCTFTDDITVTPSQLPPDAGTDKTICLEGSTVLGNPNNTGTLVWSGPAAGDLSCTQCSTPTFTPSSTGEFTFTLDQTENGCTTSDEVMVTVEELVLPAFPTSEAICQGACIEIGPQPEFGVSYIWSPQAGLDDPFSARTLACPNGPTTYTLVATNLLGCVATSSVTISFSQEMAPTVSVPDETICIGSSTSFNPVVSPTGNYDYTWSPAVGLDNPNVANPTVFGGTPGSSTYSLLVVDNNTGCNTTAQAEVTVLGADVIDLAITEFDCYGGDAVQLGATIQGNTGGFQWVTDGDGSFLPSAYVINPVYMPGLNDQASTSVQITLQAFGANCGNAFSTSVTLTRCKMAVGDLVFMDNNDNGTFETGVDMPVPNVLVELYQAGATPGADSPFASTNTNANGYYYFDQLDPGDYQIFIPASNFFFGGPLVGKASSPGADNTDNTDNNDNGIDAPLNGGIASMVFSLVANSAPEGEDQTNYPGVLDDDNVNGTIEFAFFTIYTITCNCDGSITIDWDPFAGGNSWTVTLEDMNGNPALNFVNMPESQVTIASGSLNNLECYALAITENISGVEVASIQGFVCDLCYPVPEITLTGTGPSCMDAMDGEVTITITEQGCMATYDVYLTSAGQPDQLVGDDIMITAPIVVSGLGEGSYGVRLELVDQGTCFYGPNCFPVVEDNLLTLQNTDNTAPTKQVLDASGAEVTDMVFNYDELPEGECGVQFTWTVLLLDNCQSAGVDLTATITTSSTNPSVTPSAQVTVLDNEPTYAVEVFAAVGTNTLTLTATDANGNSTDMVYTINVADNREPVLYCPSDMNVEIPACEEDVPVNWTVSVVDDCDIQPTLVQTAGPASGDVLTPGMYTVSYEATDDYNNIGTCSFNINVTQAPSPEPIVDVSGNGSFNIEHCEEDGLIVFSGNVYDCELTPFNFNPADLTVSTIPLSPGAIGNLTISYTLPQDGYVYFEATGNLTAGSYIVETTYKGVTVDHGVIVTQDPDEPAVIDMPGNLSYTIPECSGEADVSFAVQLTDDCDEDLSSASFTVNGNPAPPFDPVVSDPVNGLYVWNLSLAVGTYTIEGTYTDGAGNTTTNEATITVNSNGQDDWAPIIVYPSQNIDVELDPCAPSTAVIAFEVTATDNCDAMVTPVVSATCGTIIPQSSAGGSTYIWTGGVGTCTVNISATDNAGNTRTEDFQIVVTQDPAPLAAPVCNDDINVTLDDNCQRVIRADMVLEGELGCFDNDDFTITIVNDDNPSNGNILDGCGQFIYEIDLNALPEINGFNGDYAAVNWLVIEENGSSVDIGATTATLVSSDAGGCFNAEGSMTTTVPNDGTISFDYNYVTSDPVFELHMIQVTASGVTTDIVDINSSGSGSVNIPVGSGDVLYIAVVSVDCILGPGTATISNFNFQPATALPGPIDWEPCWGFITGEDKDAPIIECPPNTGTGTIVKNGYTLSGTIDVNDPQVVVNDWSCLIDNTQPNFPGTRYVDVQSFQVDSDDIYTFLVQSDVTQTGNVGFAIYQGGYDPTNPCENIIAQADIPQNPGVGNPLPGSQGNDPSVRLALPLQAGATYTIVTTTFTPDATGNYQYSICSDGDGQVGFFDTTFVTNPDWSVDEIVTFLPFPTAPVTIDVRLYCGDFDLIFNNPASLPITGAPIVSDNCDATPDVTFVDTYQTNGDCGDIVITRTFTATDEKGNSSSCIQLITLTNVTATTGTDSEVWLPPFTVPIECDEDFPTLANGHPTPAVAGYPFVFTASGIFDLNDDYCNVGASYEDGADIVVCDGAFKFIRTWTIVDWCDPINFYTYPQVIKVGDFTKPVVVCPGEDYDWDGDLDPLVYSTSPFSCTASFSVPLPTVTDNCSGWEVYTEIRTTVEVDVTNQYGQVTGTALDTVTVRVVEWDAPTRFVSGIPLGNHFFYYVVEDDCGNKTTVYCDFSVRDQIEPVAVCDDQLNISIGGGDFARVFAENIDEGSWDNCEIDRIEVRRNKFDPINYTCGNSFSLWGPYVDFFCCDVGVEIEIQLRVIDKAGNINTCWLNVTPEEKVRPYCYAPHNVMVDCDELPYDFDPFDTDQLQDLFGAPSADDNCEATAEELPPVVDLECGFGRIIRRFRATDIHGNTSVNFCQQIVDIKEVHNFEIKFPEDAEAICGVADPDSVIYEEIACDLLAVSHTDEFFSASGDECYKIFRTWKVINWCQYDGESAPLVIGRDEDCDNNPGDECVWVLHRPNGYTYIDRDDDETEPNNVPLAFQNICQGFDDFWRKVEYDGGFYQYTQIIKVYDDIDPEIIFTAQTFCSYDNVNCDGVVNYPFEIDENCTPDDLTIKVFLDAGADGTIDLDLTATGQFGFTLTGTYPNYNIGGQYPIGCHAFEVHVEDGCGNVNAELLPFCVEDCKSPSPICINGLAIELMPFDVDGDDVPDEGRMGIWASDFIASPVFDCTGPVKYSMNRSGEAPNIDSTGIVLTCADTGTLVVEIWAWDGAGNSDFCETYILVQDNMGSCGSAGPGVAGAIGTEAGSAVENVDVSLSGQSNAGMTTTATGEYAFADLVEGSDYSITPQLDGDYLNGVSTFDLVILSQHILGVQLLDSPYKLIAGDVNNSESITTLDLIQLRKLILSIDTEFANNTSWRFVDADYVFPNPANPWVENFPEVININNMDAAGLASQNFVAVKIGDVNLDAETNSLVDVEDRNVSGALSFEVAEASLKAGNEYTVEFAASEIAAISGYQATLVFDTKAVELVDVVSGIATEDNFGFAFVDEGLVTTSWNQHSLHSKEIKSGVMFSVVLRATADVQLSEVLGVSSRITKAEAYDNNGEYMDVAIEFSTGTFPIAIGTAGFELYQNTPNPFNGETLIGFNLPAAENTTITITDTKGRLIRLINIEGVKGYNSVVLDSNGLPRGVLQYTVKSGQYIDTKTMITLD